MDNFSQERLKQNSQARELDSKEGEDITFEENINVEEIQKILKHHMEEDAFTNNLEWPVENEEEQVFSDSVAPPVSSEEFAPQLLEANQLINESQEVDSRAKKYVVYIEPENIEFMEKLSIPERKLVINKLLKEQDEIIISQKQQEKTNKFLRHAIVAALTVVIGLPLLHLLINKSLEVTIANYQNSVRNFSTLYREKGKIRQQRIR